MKVFAILKAIFCAVFARAVSINQGPLKLNGSELEASSTSKYGIILIPTVAKLITKEAIEVHIRGRLSSPINEQEVKSVIDATGLALVPESLTDQIKNAKLRQSYFYTSALSGLPVDLELKDGVNMDFSIPNSTPQSVRSDIDGSFTLTGVISRKDGREFKHGEKVEYSVGGVAGYLTVSSVEGFSIVADVDDTIKDTGALWLPELIANTFLRPFRVAPTMPELFTKLKEELPQADFYYLSGMPVQFLPAEEPFIENHFPQGEFVLPFLSKATGGIAKILDYKKFKIEQSLKIIYNFPQRKLVLFGDATQLDPEAYAEVYKQQPDSIQCIFIRLVEGYNWVSERSKNDPYRFLRAFIGVPHSKWMVFRNATELPSAQDVQRGQCRDPNWFQQ